LLCLFGSGTSLQELYITPLVITSDNWDQLSEIARWSRQNEDVLADTHWVGGYPSALAVYGWASWSPRKGILVLRNPSDQLNSIAIDAAQVFELPPGAASTYGLSTLFADQSFTNATLVAGQPTVIGLQPFEVLVLEVTPRLSYADWVQQSFPTNSDPATVTATADPDGDGMPNLLEYAFHTDPTTVVSPATLRFSKSNNSVTLEFNWNLAATEVSWVIETSVDLRSWQPAAVTAYASYVGSGNMRISAISPVGSESLRFYRVRLSQTSSQLQVDSNGDGIPDWWTQKYFGGDGTTTNNLSCATCDPDGDGMNNVVEFQTGTDPTNSMSALRILEIAMEADDMLLTWAAVGGKRYVVQTTTGYKGSYSKSFVDLDPSIVAPGTGETAVTVLHLGGATNSPTRYYRVRLVP
jgi:hypothetical protein